MSTDVKLLKKPKASLPRISLIGMAGSGKTTIGVALARALGWAFIDTDSLIEAAYATRLQDISDALSRDAFLDMEADFICSLRTSRTVISTGGSVGISALSCVWMPRSGSSRKESHAIPSADLSSAKGRHWNPSARNAAGSTRSTLILPAMPHAHRLSVPTGSSPSFLKNTLPASRIVSVQTQKRRPFRTAFFYFWSDEKFRTASSCRRNG